VGLPWLDQYTGGIRTGDVIGVLGPYGGGKSTLLTVAAVRLAHHFAINGENKLSVFIGYEDGGAKWNHMFWSAAARIQRKMFTDHGTDIWSHFSTRESLKDYDRLLPENRNGEIVFGERERWEAAIPWLNRHFVFLDFSCNSETGGQGAGGVPEIVNALERLAEERGMEIGFVAIDYAGLLVERSISAKSYDLKDIIRPIKKVPDDLRTMLAVPTGATVMLAHQLAPGDLKGIPVYRHVGHLQASGSKSFAENVHSCMGINQRDHATNVSTIYWSKIRANMPETPYGLIKMDDHVVDMHLVNDDYVACATTRAIIRKGDVRVVNPYAESGSRDNEQRRGWSTDTMPGDF
jgi:energy-coupling factor transporter ATP-binding protein EcfA2